MHSEHPPSDLNKPMGPGTTRLGHFLAGARRASAFPEKSHPLEKIGNDSYGMTTLQRSHTTSAKYCAKHSLTHSGTESRKLPGTCSQQKLLFCIHTPEIVRPFILFLI